MKRITKIIISIDEKDKKYIDKVVDNSFLATPTVDAILNAVRNGTPLPKGHGDLIDRNALYAGPHFEMNGKVTVGEKDFGIRTFDMFAKRDIDAMKPLIPADKETEDEVTEFINELKKTTTTRFE